MLRKKLIIFDLDGVIYPVTELQMERIIDSSKEALSFFESEKGNVPTFEFLKAHWGVSIVQMAELFVDKLYWTDEQANVFLYQENKTNHYFKNGLASGFLELIKTLKEKGIKVAICSNRRTKSFYPLLKKMGLSKKYFSYIILSDSLEGGIKKPDKRVLDPILETYQKKDLVFVGDSLSADFQTAVNAGIDFVGISSILHKPKDFQKAFKAKANGNTCLVLAHVNQLQEIYCD